MDDVNSFIENVSPGLLLTSSVSRFSRLENVPIHIMVMYNPHKLI